MEKSIALANLSSISRQRNLFVTLSLFMAVSILLLVVKLITVDEKTILVPGLNQEVWTKENGVSGSYLSEVTLMYLPLLLDLSPETINYKADLVFQYVSQSNLKYMKNLQEYFSSAEKKYRQFGLSTYFAVKDIEVNTKKLQVKANGTLTSRYGQEGLQTDKLSYMLSFEWLSGKLRLKEFEQLKNEKEKSDEKVK